MCNPQHSLLRRCPHSASGPEQQRLRLCRAPLDTSRTPNWSFSSPHLLSRHVQACALSTPKQSMPNELPVRGRRGRRGLGPPPCLLMLPQAPQPSARAFCRGRRSRCPQALSFFFLFDVPKEGLGIGDAIMVTQPGRRRERRPSDCMQ